MTRAWLERDLGISPSATLSEVERWMDTAGVRPESPIERGVAALRAALGS